MIKKFFNNLVSFGGLLILIIMSGILGFFYRGRLLLADINRNEPSICNVKLIQKVKELINNDLQEKLLIENSTFNDRLIIRPLEEPLDSMIKERVSIFREASLTNLLQNEGNFAYALIDADGLKDEIVAHSFVDEEYLFEVNSQIFKMIGKPEAPVFKAFEVRGSSGNYFLRDIDTEYKIINYFANLLKNKTEASGKILLYTDRSPCLSCNFLIKKFLLRYKNIRIEVLYETLYNY